MSDEKPKIKMVARNRRARHDYDVRQSFEAGIELKGREVKSLREGKINLADSYATIENGEVILKNLHISKYKMAAHEELDPMRPRRLLLTKREIRKLIQGTQQKSMTLIPLAVYFKGPYAKIELALAIGRKKYDKREAIARAEAERQISQARKKDY